MILDMPGAQPAGGGKIGLGRGQYAQYAGHRLLEPVNVTKQRNDRIAVPRHLKRSTFDKASAIPFHRVAEPQFSMRALHRLARNRLQAGHAGLFHELGGPCCVSSFNRPVLIAPSSMLPKAKSS
ncbi:hypothetical protein [Allomesorhizobium alhagi]|uniref:Uncharacterized protein n=1 Tax=Mesorhizobium alhagi CCNWXJ12-2 TaxID=1107882 RepID=H0I3V8_9HYPH|nr:hypothetical protein [Mesorhizobium alhagi]EHK52315.1 hypothetical protein MAXJ12_35876 [Mesorhizobium alhagi CCNWXJ12-2]